MQYVLVTGCARSGTSILAELIASHPEVQYEWEHARGVWSLLSQGQGDYFDGVVYKDQRKTILDYFQKVHDGSPVFLDKNPICSLKISGVNQVFPFHKPSDFGKASKLIYIVRDGRDVACSMLPGLKNSWMHLKPDNWRFIQSNYQGIKRTGLAWTRCVEIASFQMSQLDFQDNVLEIQYERLVRDPIEASKTIFRFIGLEDRVPQVQKFLGAINDDVSSYNAGKSSVWTNFDRGHNRRIRRFERELSYQQIKWLNAHLGFQLKQFGYDV